MTPYRRALRTVRGAATWHLTSVQVARRNALVSSTELAQRRRELHEVEEFLARHAERWHAAHGRSSRSA